MAVPENYRLFKMINNYIYLYHINKFIVLPTYADQIVDSMPAHFTPTTPLSRSAPIYSYQNSGPRSIQFTFHLHRDLMTQINYGVSDAILGVNDDYTDFLINNIRACALPAYRTASKMVNPPIVAVRLENEIFIKGIINGDVSVSYKLPIIRSGNGPYTTDNGPGRYSLIDVSFTVSEMDPYDASIVSEVGGFRGLSTSLERNIWTSANTTFI